MNAKKIMGAVLVALLAAALFVGAGAAATNNGTVFVYEISDKIEGTWTYGANTITAINNGTAGYYYFAGDSIVEGTYKKDDYTITVKYPTATITALANTTVNGQVVEYIVDGAILYTGSNVTFTVAPADGLTIDYVLVTYPDGTVNKNFTKVITNNKFELTFTETNGLLAGQYKLQPVYNKSGFAAGTPNGIFASKAVYTFTVANSANPTISAAVASVLENSVIDVTVTGKPGAEYTITATKFTSLSYNGVALPKSDNKYTLDMPNDGKVTLQAKAGSSGAGKLSVQNADGTGTTASISITIEKGVITAALEKDSYFIGNNVKISGTSTAAKTLYLYVAGTNIDLAELAGSISVDVNGNWDKDIGEEELKLKSGEKLDAGSYTLYVATNSGKSKVSDLGTYVTVALVLKQPFISEIEGAAVAVKGTTYEVTGIAEATDKLAVYIFGTNFFTATNGTQTVAKLNPTVFQDTTGQTIDIFGNKSDLTDSGVEFDSEKTNEFTITLQIPEHGMAAGQYYMIIQHPMYDGVFNIQAADSTIYLMNATLGLIPEPLFNVTDRQTTNAAQALSDALDTQNIDDMYNKFSFVVGGATSTINPIPSEITKGSKLTVSGTTNVGKDKVVTVELLSTAFAAVPKEAVGSASFIALTTKTDKDGNWEVTFDTTDLNVDEYTLSVAVASLDQTSVKVNVIEGAPTEQPTTQPTETQQPTTQPTETEAPTTPGFGALAALAGLGAVAVLLLRRE